MDQEREFLRSVELLRDFDAGELDRFSSALVATEFPPGQLILEEGQPNRALHIVRSGRVRVSRHVEDSDVILCDLTVGRSFGELSILDEGVAIATLRAIPKTTILSISMGDLQRILRDSPSTAAKFWRAIAVDLRERLIQTNDVVRTYFEVNQALVENPTFREAYAMVSR